MNTTPAVPPLPVSLPLFQKQNALADGERLLPTCLAAGVLVVLGDFLFWNFSPGLSLAIFAAAVAAIMLLRKGRAAWQARVLIPFGLLLVSAVQAAIEMSFTNLAVIAALFAIMMGELYYTHLAAGWARWSESIVAWLCASGRWVWLAQAVSEQPVSQSGSTARLGDRLFRAIRIGLPAVLLLGLFAGVFASGNRIFADYVARYFDHLRVWLLSFDFSVPRLLFWFFLATFALVFIRPRTGPVLPRKRARPFREWRRADASIAFWQSVMILAVLNALFFAVNTIDVVYLWMHTAVPAGLNGKQFLHDGVNSLITATVLAGIVLTFLFQQSEEVTHPPALKGLAFAWIAQNLVLIAGVFLRLKLYVVTEEMTAKRVYVACFLLLVTLGFAFLCAQVRRGREAGRLVWRNAVTTFALFFVLQFLDVIGWVCRFNVTRGTANPDAMNFNISYQLTLGPNAWPVLLQARKTLPAGELRDDLRLGLREVARRTKDFAGINWRETQFRRDQNTAALFAWAKPLGPLTDAERGSRIIGQFDDALRKLNPRWGD